MWNAGWDNIFKNREWGKYPATEVVRFIARNFYSVENRRDIKILEIGCGTGANLWFIVKEGFSAAGIDGSEVAIARLKKRLEEEKLEAELYVGDAMHLPFSDNQFDCVIDCECIYANSFKDSLTIVKEVSRVLKPDGKFLSMTFMSGSYGDGSGKKLKGEENTYLELSEGPFHKGYGIVRFTSEQDLKRLYGDFFEIKNIDYTMRSQKNRTHVVKEWLITCQKPSLER